MKTRAAVLTAYNEPLVIDEVELPAVGPDDVAVKLISSGVCHSQLHELNGSLNEPLPMVLGHEGTGVVMAVGAHVNHVKEGDHAIVTWVRRHPDLTMQDRGPLGASHRGTPLFAQHRVHTWSEHVVTEGEHVVGIADDAPTDLSCIIGCAVLTGAGAVQHTAGVRPGDSVAVIGAGGVGLSAIWMASVLEAYPIIAADLRDDKLEMARQFGATHLVNARNEDPVAAIKELTNGGVDYAFDTIGVRATSEQILAATRPGWVGPSSKGGTAVLVGVPAEREMTINPMLVMPFQRTYTGSHGASDADRDFPMFLRLYAEGKFPLDKLVTDRYRLEQINEACDALRAGDVMGRAILEY